MRQALTGLAGALGLDAIETNDLNTAVTEACNNVVMHAYDGAEGPLELEVHVRRDAVAVLVRDRGVGIDLHRVVDQAGSDDADIGMGIAVIDALADYVAFAEMPTGGTEVHMEFPLRKTNPVALAAASSSSAAADGDRQVTSAGDARPGAVEVRLAPSALARAVLPRVLSVLAARAHFSTDRISDVQIVADLLAAGTQGAKMADAPQARARDEVHAAEGGGHLSVSATIAPRRLELSIGPLPAGGSESLSVAADGLVPVIERLTDGKRIAAGEDASCEMLELSLVDHR